MNNIPRQMLCDLIEKEGIELCNNQKRCKALLSDLCGEYRKEISALVGALKERVVDELQKLPQNVPFEVSLGQLAKRMQDNLAIAEEAAIWAVESWALALGVISSVELSNFWSTDTTSIYNSNSEVTQYSLSLTFTSAGNKSWRYFINLHEDEEDQPELFFSKNNRQQRQRFKAALQKELGRTVNNAQIDLLLDKWCRQISLGYRTIGLKL